MEERLVYITAASAEQAEGLGRALVEARLVACANVLAGATSIYWWQGQIQREREAVLVAKTRADLIDAVVAEVRRLHTYEVPCVVALPLVGGNPDFLAWIRAETQAPQGTAR